MEFHNFLVCLDNKSAKNCRRHSRNLCILLRRTLAFFQGLRNWFFNSWDYLFYLIYIVYLEHTWTGETEDNISLVDHFFLVSSCVLVIIGELYLLKPRTGQNEPKPAKKSQNQPKQPKKLQNDPKQPKISKLGKFWIFYLLLFSKFQEKMPKFGHFRPKSIDFLTVARFCMYPILNVLLSNLSFVFEYFELKSPNFGI